ncbi:MAG: ATP phosphoribosyltransferase [Bifidobacteriaceae bacterium]|jgi:ATP phosphoribosyltransferase|nr:ATP phosphoribosyltransferase [Bifidobacteriaceae bacterium]
MLRIAVPNKGSLSEPAAQLLTAAGYAKRPDSRQLVVVDEANEIEFFYLRPRDVAVYVGKGTVDAGITGRDLLLDSGTEAVEHLALGFGGSTFRFAARADEVSTLEQIDGKRIATSYPLLVGNYLKDHDVTPSAVVRLDGAVESAIRLGVADVVADVVSTGTTLRAAGLTIFGDPLLKSEGVLIRRPELVEGAKPGFDVLVRRMEGVLVARRYVLMDYDVPLAAVERAVSITPGLESPTVSPLHDHQWAAVRAMVPKADMNRLMDQLYEAGARAILVTEITACRL